VGISFCYKLLAKGQIVNFSENSTEEDYGLVTKLINLGYSYTITKETAYAVRPEDIKTTRQIRLPDFKFGGTN
jgi:hypothetical protein